MQWLSEFLKKCAIEAAKEGIIRFGKSVEVEKRKYEPPKPTPPEDQCWGAVGCLFIFIILIIYIGFSRIPFMVR